MITENDEQQLTAYAMSELSKDEQSRVEALLESDPLARQVVEEIREVAKMLRNELKTEAAPRLTDQQRRAVQARAAKRSWRKVYLGGGLAAASILFLIGAAALVPQFSRSPELAKNAAPTFQRRLRVDYEDALVVDRSELIVVAHLKEGTVQYVPHKKKPHEGSSWEHHATLVVKEVLKGQCDDKEIPLIIHYGLRPVAVEHGKRKNFMIDSGAAGEDYPKGAIAILDTPGSSIRLLPLVKDAREDHLWFLRKRSGTFGRKPGTGKYGIVDPEDLRPLEWKDYFLLYMADNPQSAIKEYAKKNPEKADRARKYLDHMEIQRILKIKDPKQRYDNLLPYFLNDTTWNGKSEARSGIISCGKVAGDNLRNVFADPKHKVFRRAIILMWRDIGYREVVPLLIDLLTKHDQFWANQDLQKGWWNDDVSSERTRRRRDIYGEVYYGVCALGSFQDPRAREVIDRTRKRWAAIGFDNRQIVEECEAALRKLTETEGTAQPDAPASADEPHR